MRRDRRDLSAAWGKTGPLFGAGPWLSDLLVLDRPRRAASARSARTAQPDDRSSCRRAPALSPSALVNIVGGTCASGGFSESSAERADGCRGSWIRKPQKRLHLARNPINVAINSEASMIIFHDGWYYLLVTDGSGCAGANSSCNIHIGRSREVTGPFVDNMGIDMPQTGGTLFASSGRHVGPGHFGLLDLGGGVQKFSGHHEADLDRSGGRVLDFGPLL